MLEIVTLVLGFAATNCYLIAEAVSGEAVVIDPAWDGHAILSAAQKRGWKIGQFWYTHAHFDHFGASAELAEALQASAVPGDRLPLSVALHSLEKELWQNEGGAPLFGMHIDPGPEPTILLSHGQILRLGNIEFEARHTPGHSPGHVAYYCAESAVLFSGDLIFQGSVGRTDLPGGDWNPLVESIRNQVYNLPDETRILPGHGAETSVGEEKHSNPFVRI
jgi:glyoxylase-like metal-dependent hydrolase (beta-lactamase superfamily II)